MNKEKQYSEIEKRVAILLPGLERATRVILAVATASQRQFPAMIWLLLVDVPSSGKTDLVRLIKDTATTYYLDNLTQNAFISGERVTKSNKVFDLLPELNNKCFIVKDWTSIFSLDEKATKKLLGDLVNIYDKEFVKHSSARGTIRYESYFSHLGCITPATLNKHTQYLNMVGARFLFYNLPEVSQEDEELSKKRIFSEENRSEIEALVRTHVCTYLQDLLKREWDIQPLSSEVEKYLWICAELVAHCRGIIILQSSKFINEKGEERTSYEPISRQIEKSWRALLQLKSLAQCLAFVVGKNEIQTEELEFVKEIVLSSMPADRSQALRAIQKHGGIITAKELSDVSELSYITSRRLLEELTALKVIDKIPGSGSMASDFKISDKFKDFICKSTEEFLSTYSSGTETPQWHNNTTSNVQTIPTPTNNGLPKAEQENLLDEDFKFTDFD